MQFRYDADFASSSFMDFHSLYIIAKVLRGSITYRSKKVMPDFSIFAHDVYCFECISRKIKLCKFFFTDSIFALAVHYLWFSNMPFQCTGLLIFNQISVRSNGVCLANVTNSVKKYFNGGIEAVTVLNVTSIPTMKGMFRTGVRKHVSLSLPVVWFQRGTPDGQYVCSKKIPK